MSGEFFFSFICLLCGGVVVSVHDSLATQWIFDVFVVIMPTATKQEKKENKEKKTKKERREEKNH